MSKHIVSILPATYVFAGLDPNMHFLNNLILDIAYVAEKKIGNEGGITQVMASRNLITMSVFEYMVILIKQNRKVIMTMIANTNKNLNA